MWTSIGFCTMRCSWQRQWASSKALKSAAPPPSYLSAAAVSILHISTSASIGKPAGCSGLKPHVLTPKRIIARSVLSVTCLVCATISAALLGRKIGGYESRPASTPSPSATLQTSIDSSTVEKLRCATSLKPSGAASAATSRKRLYSSVVVPDSEATSVPQ